MLLGKLKRILVASLGGMLIGGTVLYAAPRPGHSQRSEGRLKIRPAEVRRRIETPAPRDLRVASGHGKVLVYALDDNGDRIPDRPQVKNGPFRQTQREINWAVVTGVIDHDQVQKSFIMAHRRPVPPAESLYRRVDLERRALQKDGSWSRWARLDIEAIFRILDNVPAIEEERVSPRYRVDGLVDPLPFLTAGEWRGADVDEFIPEVEEHRPVGQAGDASARGERPPVLMIRSFDFTVEPGRTYRYRARVVLINPHYNRQKPDDRKEILGPWSAATDVVTVPSS